MAKASTRRAFLRGTAAMAASAVGVSQHSAAAATHGGTLPPRADANLDVVVVGGGPAGVCAAIAAARHGAGVLVIEQSNCLGGMGTQGLVGPFMTCYDKSGKIQLI